MTLAQALDVVVAKTRVERYRYLCLEHPSPKVRDEYSRLVMDLAGGEFPSLATQAGNALAAAGRVAGAAIAGGAVLVSEDERDRRQAICDGCEFWDQKRRRCRKCGCGKAKLHLATERRPIGKWERVPSSVRTESIKGD